MLNSHFRQLSPVQLPFKGRQDNLLSSHQHILPHNMIRIFILEDDAQRIELFYRNLPLDQVDLIIAKDIYQARKLWAPPYDIVCLDHDLDGQIMVDISEENTGSTFVNEVLTGPLHLLTGKYFVHSWNPDAGDNMHLNLVNAGVESTRQMFGPRLFVLLKETINVN